MQFVDQFLQISSECNIAFGVSWLQEGFLLKLVRGLISEVSSTLRRLVVLSAAPGLVESQQPVGLAFGHGISDYLVMQRLSAEQRQQHTGYIDKRCAAQERWMVCGKNHHRVQLLIQSLTF
jgi:hypothetical protein